jgi:hypothetical protein
VADTSHFVPPPAGTGYRDSDSPFAATAPLFGAPADPRTDPGFGAPSAPSPQPGFAAVAEPATGAAAPPPDPGDAGLVSDPNERFEPFEPFEPVNPNDAAGPATVPVEDWPSALWPSQDTPAPAPHTVEAAMALALATTRSDLAHPPEPAPWAPDSQLDGEAFSRPTLRVPPATSYTSALLPAAGQPGAGGARPRWSGEVPQGPVPLQEPGFDADGGSLHAEGPLLGDTAHAFDAQADAAADAAVTPSFVRDADRAQRWHSPRRRALLASLAVLATLALLAQVALQYRDLLAARVPALRPLLVQVCEPLGCRVDAARAIDSLVVESSGLVRQGRSNLYKLQLQLRNRAGIEVALPALDVTLTDVRGAVIARKVLQGAELGQTQTTVAAGRDVALQATLQVGAPGAEPIAGYTVELFYP